MFPFVGLCGLGLCSMFLHEYLENMNVTGGNWLQRHIEAPGKRLKDREGNNLHTHRSIYSILGTQSTLGDAINIFIGK